MNMYWRGEICRGGVSQFGFDQDDYLARVNQRLHSEAPKEEIIRKAVDHYVELAGEIHSLKRVPYFFGHRRIAWLILNYVLINHGLAPFYFSNRRKSEHGTSETEFVQNILHQITRIEVPGVKRDRLSRSELRIALPSSYVTSYVAIIQRVLLSDELDVDDFVQALDDAKASGISLKTLVARMKASISQALERHLEGRLQLGARAILSFDKNTLIEHRLIEHRVTEAEIADLEPEDAIAVLEALFQAARDAVSQHAKLRVRLVIPEAYIDTFKHIETNRYDQFRQIPLGKQFFIYNSSLTPDHYTEADPDVVVSALTNGIETTVHATDTYGDGTHVRYNGEANVNVAANLFYSTLIRLAGGELAKKLFTQEPNRDIYRVKSRHHLTMIELVMYTLQSMIEAEALRAQSA